MRVGTVLLIEGSVNLLVTLCKLYVGVSVGSMAIIADAFHSATDTLDNVIAWFAHRIAVKPADTDHPYGHRKFEFLAIFMLGILLVVVALEVVWHALTSVNTQPQQSVVGVVLLLASAGVSLGLALFERFHAAKNHSRLLSADAKHSFADSLVSLSALLGWQFALLGFIWIDSLTAVFIAGFILYLAYTLFRETIPILVDQAAIWERDLIKAAAAVPGVVRVKKVRSRSTGEGIIVEIKAAVAPHINTRASHQIADQLEVDLTKRFNLLDVIVHIEPN
ncbi:MAG: cation diffusion facilitator family transporter [Aestuariibacter sp.]